MSFCSLYCETGCDCFLGFSFLPTLLAEFFHPGQSADVLLEPDHFPAGFKPSPAVFGEFPVGILERVPRIGEFVLKFQFAASQKADPLAVAVQFRGAQFLSVHGQVEPGRLLFTPIMEVLKLPLFRLTGRVQAVVLPLRLAEPGDGLAFALAFYGKQPGQHFRCSVLGVPCLVFRAW